MAKVQELPQAMRRLIEDAALRGSYGAYTRAIVKAYEAGVVLDKLEALYQGLKTSKFAEREEIPGSSRNLVLSL